MTFLEGSGIAFWMLIVLVAFSLIFSDSAQYSVRTCVKTELFGREPNRKERCVEWHDVVTEEKKAEFEEYYSR